MDFTDNRLVAFGQSNENIFALGLNKELNNFNIQPIQGKSNNIQSLKKQSLSSFQLKNQNLKKSTIQLADENSLFQKIKNKQKNNLKKSQKSIKSFKPIEEFNQNNQTDSDIPICNFNQTNSILIKPINNHNQININQEQQNKQNQQSNNKRKFKKSKINKESQQINQDCKKNSKVKCLYEKSVIAMQSNIQKVRTRTRIFQKLDFSNIQNTAQFMQAPIQQGNKLYGKIIKCRTLIGSLSNVSFSFGKRGQLLVKSYRQNTPGFSASKHKIMLSNIQNSNQQEQACIQSNFLGSLYNIYNTKNINNPFSSQNIAQNRNQITNDRVSTLKHFDSIVATICYTSSYCLSLNQNRKIEVYIRDPKNGQALINQFDLKTYQPINLRDLYENYEPNQQKIIKLVTKQPLWNQKKQKWTLNLHGLAKIDSVHNFILQIANDNDKSPLKTQKKNSNEVFIMGKTQKDQYQVNFKYPLSAKIGVGIILSSLDFKWICQ